MAEISRLHTLLAGFKNEQISSRLTAGLDDSGNLVLEGYDVGSLVEKMWGDGDYEYWITVDREMLPRVAEERARESHQTVPDGSRREQFIVDTLRTFFSEPEAQPRFKNSSAFRKWLEAHAIPSGFSTGCRGPSDHTVKLICWPEVPSDPMIGLEKLSRAPKGTDSTS